MAYAILRVAKLKTAGQVSAVGGHNARIRDTPNANESVTNRVLAGDGIDAWPGVQARIAGAGSKIRKNGVLACEVFLGASPEYFRPQGGAAGTWDAARLEAWQAKAWTWLQQEWGKDNVVAAVVHLDEATPHLQAVVVPIDPASGRMNAARWLNGRKALMGMQDRYAAAMGPLGLERGIRGSTAEHTSVREWYGHLQGKSPAIPAPVVQPPEGVLAVMSEAKREAYAQEETQRLKDLQGPKLEALQTRARAYELSDQKRSEHERTAKRLAVELAAVQKELAETRSELGQAVTKYQGLAALLRPVPLSQAVGWYGPEELAAAGIGVGTNQAGQERLYDLTTKRVVGRNAIDLAMRVGKTDYRGAVDDLTVRAGQQVVQQVVISCGVEALSESRDRVVSAPVIALRLQRAERASAMAGFTQMGQVFKRHGFDLSVSISGKSPLVEVVEVFTKQRQQLEDQMLRQILAAHQAEMVRRQVAARHAAEVERERQRNLPPPSRGMSR